MVILEKKMTWQEFREMEVDEQDNSIYELINGILMRRTSPSIKHQIVSRNLTEALGLFLKANPIGQYLYAPTDVFFDEHNGVVPDVSFVKKERLFVIENGEYINGAPDLIIEIISPGSVKRDRVEKKELYEKFAVKEYWLIDPANKTVEIFTIQKNAYILKAFLEMEGQLTSDMLQGFEIDLSELFD